MEWLITILYLILAIISGAFVVFWFVMFLDALKEKSWVWAFFLVLVPIITAFLYYFIEYR